MAGTLKVTIDDAVLKRILKQTPEQVSALLDSLAEQLVNDIKLSFGTSPSAPGDPPGVDTGTLTGSMKWDPEGDTRRVVHDGTTYGIYLEQGTERMAPRPFVGPAVERLRQQLPEIVKNFGVVK